MIEGITVAARRTLVVIAAEVSVGVVGCLLVVGFAGHVVEVVFDDGEVCWVDVEVCVFG